MGPVPLQQEAGLSLPHAVNLDRHINLKARQKILHFCLWWL